MFSEIFNYLG